MVQMPHWPKKIIKSDGISDLSRMENLLAQIGSPHLRLPPAIHVAGTNGKGSTCAMLKAIYKEAGYRVHLYTSPHIINFNERIEISGQKIDDEALFDYLERVRIASESINLEPTFFEATTAAAFLAFAENEADLLIIETGLGGRLDPTNVIPNPLLTIITPISYDHMEYLGPDIRLIANEKAGVIKKGVPCVISRQDESVIEILLAKCEEKSSPAIAYEYDYIPEKNEEGFLFRSRLGDLQIGKLSLCGDHQIINASAVLAANFIISKLFSPLRLSEEKIANSIIKAEWPGRLQKFDISKIIKKPINALCYLDGAHNVAGAAALADWIKTLELKTRPILIVGLTKNRDVCSFLSQLKELDSIIYSVRVLSEPSAYSAVAISDKAKESGIEVSPKDSVEEALLEALEVNEDGVIVICGSLFLVSDCLKLARS